MSLYRVYRDDEVHFIVSTEGVLKKLDQDTWIEVPQEDLVKTWNEIVERMANKTRKEEQDRIFANIRSVLLGGR